MYQYQEHVLLTERVAINGNERNTAVDASYKQRNSSLHLAVFNNLRGLTLALLSSGADSNITNSLQQTPLHIACQHGCDDVCQDLVSHFANVNAQDFSGMTPLHYSAWSGNEDIIKILLKSGADITITDKNGNSCVAWSSWKDHFGLRSISFLLLTHWARQEIVKSDSSQTMDEIKYQVVRFMKKNLNPLHENLIDNAFETAFAIEKFESNIETLKKCPNDLVSMIITTIECNISASSKTTGISRLNNDTLGVVCSFIAKIY